MAGTDLYWGHGEDALRALAEALGVPVFLNGLARGCVPADHELFFSRARGAGAEGRRRRAGDRRADGLPPRLRRVLRRGHRDRRRSTSPSPSARHPRAGRRRALRRAAGDARRAARGRGRRRRRARARGSRSCATIEDEQRAAERERARGRARAAAPDARLRRARARCSTATRSSIGDGGDFVSYAGRVIDSYEPGCWLDPGPFGCLGSGPGYALAAKLARPDRQVVLLLGDGAFGFSGMEFDTLARHGVAVVGVMGNNGIWALEKHPMEFLYGYSVAADLRPETRYDQVVEALGGHGELVREPGELRAGARARASRPGEPALVNVLTDPSVAYPRKSNLA